MVHLEFTVNILDNIIEEVKLSEKCNGWIEIYLPKMDFFKFLPQTPHRGAMRNIIKSENVIFPPSGFLT